MAIPQLVSAHSAVINLIYVSLSTFCSLILVSYSIAYTPRQSKIRIFCLLLLVINSFIVLSKKVIVINLAFGISTGTMSVVYTLRGLETLYLRDDLAKPLPREDDCVELRKGTVFQCLHRAFMLFIDTRDAGTPFRAKNTPRFLQSRPHYIPTNRLYLLQLFTNIVAYYALVSVAQRLLPEDQDMFSSHREPLFSRIGGIGASEILLRTILTGYLWLLMHSRIQLFAAPIFSLLVVVFKYPAADFPPIFGSADSMYSIRGFWGKFWHQLLRNPLSRTGDLLIGMPPLSWIQSRICVRYIRILTVFFLSGISHVGGHIAIGAGHTWYNVMWFFVIQALGILIEDFVQWIYRSFLTRRNTGWEIIVGYTWTVGWLTWTTPVWLFPLLRMETVQIKF